MSLPEGYPSPLDLTQGTRPYPIRERANKCRLELFREPAAPEASVAAFLASLPDFLGAKGLLELGREIAAARARKAGVVLAMGAHVIKVGCGEVVIDLMKRGLVTGLCVNGAFVIHDYEIALLGGTSEHVDKTILDGTFGWAEETGVAYGKACERGAAEGIGLGRAMAEAARGLPHAAHSVLAHCAELSVPITVHVGVGTDTVHMHPGVRGADLGAATHLDFRIAARMVTELEHGVWVNVGSAVLLPEVFLKLVSLARNLGHKLEDVVAGNLDMIQHYRTQANVIGRPVRKGISVIGHHEINLPLLRMAILHAGDAAP
ncbi:MAG: GSU2086 family protein [Planctomycetota bacterium]|jgi:hypothetical protein